MAKDTAVRLELTEDLLKSIDFKQRIRGMGPGGKILTTPTPSGTKDWIVRDTKLQGLAIRVYPGGEGEKAQVSFFVQRKMNARLEEKQAEGEERALKSASIRRVMDQWPSLSVKKARERGQIWLSMMIQGKDPAVEKAQDLRKLAESFEDKRATFAVIYDNFVNRSSGIAKSTREDRAKVPKWMIGSPLWSTPFNDVNADIVKASFDPLFQSALGRQKAPKWGPVSPDLATAWKCFRYSSKAFHDLIARKTGGTFSRRSSSFGIVSAEMKWPLPTPKKNRLDTEEANGVAWLNGLVALRDHPSPAVGVFADFILCTLIWGGRRRETQLIRWDDLDFKKGAGMFVAANTKAKRDHHFPLTPWITEILLARKEKNKEWGREDGWVFPSRQHGKPIKDHRRVLEELQKETGLWITAHDLRRTAASDTAGLSQSNGLLVAMVLSHSGGKDAVTHDYVTARVKLLRPLFEARERKFMEMAGLSAPDTQKGPIDTLIEFLQAAQQDPMMIQQISKKADAMLTMFAN